MRWFDHAEAEMSDLYARAADELKAVFDRIDDRAVDAVVAEIAGARRIVLHACGRERLQIMGFCMRLYHMGFAAAMAGDMTTPPVGHGDLLFTVCGPGYASTTSALIGVARNAGARTVVVTAQPGGETSRRADMRLVLPAQTMADDQGAKVSLLPMGSVMEGALFILFEVMVLKLMAAKGIGLEQMRARHTNLE
jgi:6-phospho-3-hexuloisomerase